MVGFGQLRQCISTIDQCGEEPANCKFKFQGLNCSMACLAALSIAGTNCLMACFAALSTAGTTAPSIRSTMFCICACRDCI